MCVITGQNVLTKAPFPGPYPIQAGNTSLCSLQKYVHLSIQFVVEYLARKRLHHEWNALIGAHWSTNCSTLHAMDGPCSNTVMHRRTIVDVSAQGSRTSESKWSSWFRFLSSKVSTLVWTSRTTLISQLHSQQLAFPEDTGWHASLASIITVAFAYFGAQNHFVHWELHRVQSLSFIEKRLTHRKSYSQAQVR